MSSNDCALEGVKTLGKKEVSYYAVCTCGWSSKLRTQRYLATWDWEQHSGKAASIDSAFDLDALFESAPPVVGKPKRSYPFG